MESALDLVLRMTARPRETLRLPSWLTCEKIERSHGDLFVEFRGGLRGLRGKWCALTCHKPSEGVNEGDAVPGVVVCHCSQKSNQHHTTHRYSRRDCDDQAECEFSF